MKKHLVIAISILYSVITSAQIKLDTKEYSISPYFVGFNGRSTEGPSWDNKDFTDLVRSINPSTFRYPAGSQGNLWDWRTGNFIPESGKKAAFPFKIEQCTAELPENTLLVYVINMAYPTPATGVSMLSDAAILSSDETLNLKIQDILEAIKAFGKAGRIPEVIELGNEFYFQNEHSGVYGKNPTLYLNHSHKIAEAIKNNYPEIKIIMIATKNGTKGRDEWNSAIYNELKNNKNLASLIDGVVQHHYVKDGYGWIEAVTDIPSVKRAIAEGYKYSEEQQSSIEEVPETVKLWFTEYGATKKNMDGTWGSALRAAAMTTGWLKYSDRIESVFWQHITDEPNVIIKSPLSLGPVGISLREIIKTMTNKSTFKRFSFENNQSLTESEYIPSLLGFSFNNAKDEENILLINLGNTISKIDLADIYSDKTIENSISYYTETPYNSNISIDNGIKTAYYNDLSNIDLKPFSITNIELKRKNTSFINSIADNDIIRYNKSSIEILSDCSINIYNTLGHNELHKKAFKNDNIDLSNLNSGIYLIQIILPDNTYFTKKITLIK